MAYTTVPTHPILAVYPGEPIGGKHGKVWIVAAGYFMDPCVHATGNLPSKGIAPWSAFGFIPELHPEDSLIVTGHIRPGHEKAFHAAVIAEADRLCRELSSSRIYVGWSCGGMELNQTYRRDVAAHGHDGIGFVLAEVPPTAKFLSLVQRMAVSASLWLSPHRGIGLSRRFGTKLAQDEMNRVERNWKGDRTELRALLKHMRWAARNSPWVLQNAQFIALYQGLGRRMPEAGSHVVTLNLRKHHGKSLDKVVLVDRSVREASRSYPGLLAFEYDGSAHGTLLADRDAIRDALVKKVRPHFETQLHPTA
ncbi:MAG TPA: hypothetical protein VGH44_02635 [Candidatus Saccharimonadia bacterium]|jgi:hypothetical protein